MTADLPPIQRLAAGGEITPSEGVSIAAFGGGDAVPTAEGKRGQDTNGFLSPLDSPYLPLDATPFGRAAKRGKRGLGSVRRAEFGTLSDPEFTLRKPPRITVRGQTVQGGSSPLRKAPLRSRV